MQPCKCSYSSPSICLCHISIWQLHSHTSEQSKPSGSSEHSCSLRSPPLSLPVRTSPDCGRLKRFTTFFAQQHRYLVMVLEGVKHCYHVSVVGLCRRKETSFSVRCRVILNALQRQQKLKSSLLVTVLGRGICSRCEAPLPSPRTFLLRFVLCLWSLARGQLSGQCTVIFGEQPLERGSKSGESRSRGCVVRNRLWVQKDFFFNQKVFLTVCVTSKKPKPVSHRGMPFLCRTRGESDRLMESEMSPQPAHSAQLSLLTPCPLLHPFVFRGSARVSL